ncbi:succinate dehydrogenase, partial [Halorubrum sp. E3]
MSTQIPKQTEESTETETEPASKGDERRAEKRRRAAERREQRQEEEAEKAAADESTVELKVFRYDPQVEGKQEPRFDTFHVPFTKGMTVLDALMYARDTYDSSLT